MSLRLWALLLCGVLRQVAGVPKSDESEDIVVLLQTQFGMQRPEEHHKVPELHFWPHARGRVGHYSQTEYGIPSQELSKVELGASLAWTWIHPTNLSAFIMGTLIDKDKNIIIAAKQGVFKYSADGKHLWSREDLRATMPVIMGDAVYVMTEFAAEMHALDLSTGRTLWKRKEAEATGVQGDMVEAHNGVVVAAVDMATPPSSIGTPSKRAIGVNASNGELLWSYTPECGIWNFMALFPDEDTLNFMDDCGGAYRLGLYNGSELWKHSGTRGSFTDGGLTLGPDGSVYTCSNAVPMEDLNTAGTNPGRMRKYRQADGALLWTTVLPVACMNFPSVTPDGESLVLAEGSNVIFAPTKNLKGKNLTREQVDEFYSFQKKLLRNESQVSHYGMEPLNGSISVFDTHTGKMRLTHDVKPWYGMGFALDEERAYNWVLGKSPLPHCGPPHWGGATIDQHGTVYIGRSTGDLYIYNPGTGEEITWPIRDGTLMGGVTFAPGLMVVPTCSWVYVFNI